MNTTITRRTYAATYAQSNDIGEYGVDLIHSDVETDDNDETLSREDAGWDWHPVAGPVGSACDDTDALLAELGWVRTEPWVYEADVGGSQGWTADVERLP